MAARLWLLIHCYTASYSGLSKIAWQGIFLNFVESILSGVFYFLSFYFINELNFTVQMVGLMTSFYGVGAILGGLMGGKLSDRISPFIISIISLLIQSGMFLGLVNFKRTEFIMIDLFFLGMATYSFITSNHTWVLAQCKDDEGERLKVINILSTVSNLGLALSAIVVGELTNYGFINIFLITSMILFTLATYLTLYQSRFIENNLTVNKYDNLIVSSDNITQLSRKIKGKFQLVLACVFLVGLIVSQISATYPIYIQEKFPEWGAKGFSLLFGMNSMLIIIFQTPLVNFFSANNKLPMVGIGAFLLGFGMLGLSISFVFLEAIIACIIYTLGEMIFFSMSQLICYQEATKLKKGYNLGCYRMVYAFSRVVGPLLGGLIYTHGGGKMVWYLCGMIGLLCFISCFLYEKMSALMPESIDIRLD